MKGRAVCFCSLKKTEYLNNYVKGVLIRLNKLIEREKLYIIRKSPTRLPWGLDNILQIICL